MALLDEERFIDVEPVQFDYDLKIPAALNSTEPSSTFASPSPTNSPVFQWQAEELQRLHQWIVCICLVDFDLHSGQTLKFAYPDETLTESEKKNVAYLALPDSHNSKMGDCFFCFRFRVDPNAKTRYKRESPFLFGFACFRQKEDATIERGYFQKSVVIITHLPYPGLFKQCVEIIGNSFFNYGPSILEASCRNIVTWPSPESAGETLRLPLLGKLFTLIPNSSIEKSTSHRYVPPISEDGNHLIEITLKKQLSQPTNVPSPETVPSHMKRNFTQICAMGYPASITIEALEISNNILEDAISIVQQKLLTVNATLNSKPIQFDTWDALKRNLSDGFFQELNIFSTFREHIKNLWYLWELAITGQPLLVVSKQAQECSEAVLCLISIISPVRFAGDYRPYFTVYDPDFKAFCNLHDHSTLPSILLGVTNPFFCKSMDNFPNTLFLGHPIKNSSNSPNLVKVTVASKPNQSSKNTSYAKKTKRNNDNSFQTIVNNQNHLVTSHNMHLQPDQNILKRLLTVQTGTDIHGETHTEDVEVAEVSAINNRILRKYFRELTHIFLQPFERYLRYEDFAKKKRFNPYLTPPRLPVFSENEFLEWVRTVSPNEFWKKFPLKTGVSTSRRTTISKIYAKFMKSPHFPSWFAEKRAKVEKRMFEQLYRVIKRLRFENLVAGMSVLDGIKMWREIQKHIGRLEEDQDSNRARTRKVLEILQKHRTTLESALPSNICFQLNRRIKIDENQSELNDLMSFSHNLKFQLIQNYIPNYH